MKKMGLLIFCLLIVCLSNAQYASFEWAKNMGNYGGTLAPSNNCGRSISADHFGNVYSTGYFNKTVDFDPGAGIYDLSSAGFKDIYISKLDSSGNFVWAKSMGYGLDDVGNSVTADASGNVYTVGHFQGIVDFDPGVGVYNLISDSNSLDIFILKLDPSGNFLWAKSMGGTSSDDANFIAIDRSDNIYTTGYFHDTVDFNPGVGTYNLATDSSVFSDIFISKLDSSGNFVWAKKLGGTSIAGSSRNAGNSIAFDTAGNIYTTGFFQGTVDFDPGSGIFNLTGYGYNGLFISKLDSAGNFVWAKDMEPNGSIPGGIVGNAIALDSSGNVYTSGFFNETIDFDPGAGIDNVTALINDVFISKLSPAGNFIWAKIIDGVSMDSTFSMAIDVSGYLYLTGNFRGTVDFDPGAGTFDLISNGYTDIFILKVDTSGNFIWAKDIGGGFFDSGRSITLDTFDNIYTTGSFIVGADFDPDLYFFPLIGHNGSDIFVQKMGQGSTGEGIIENSFGYKIDIFPNPTNGVFNIDISEQIKSARLITFNRNIEIYNCMGDLVYSKKTTNEISSIDIANLANGLYFVKVMSDNKIIASQKIVKQ